MPMDGGCESFFAGLCASFGAAIQHRSVYEMPFSEAYDLAEAGEEELSLYLEEALSCGHEVLELCCGNGRLTIPFAKNHFHITGVDLSGDMLALLEKKLQSLPGSVRNRIRILQEDVFTVDPGQTFDFIFLPATTLCILFDDAAATEQLFTHVAALLRPGGSFAFDIRLYDEVKSGEALIPQMIGKRACLSTERIDCRLGRAVGRFLILEPDNDGQVQMYLAEANKKIIAISDVEALVERTPFLIRRTERYFHDGSELMLFILKKKEVE